MPRHARKTASADVKLRETNNRLGNKYECEVIVSLPSKKLQATEATLNMFAAVDIVEAKLKNQLVKYKAAHTAHLREKYPNALKRFGARLRRKAVVEE
jgi:ribosomal subunit interface protein